MRTGILVVTISMLSLVLQGCSDCKCTSTLGECPGGATQPSPPTGVYCFYEPVTKQCGGCPYISHLWGTTECYDVDDGQSCADCDHECTECKKVRFGPGALCVLYRNDPQGCAAQECEYGILPS